jgi:hypothetical protein
MKYMGWSYPALLLCPEPYLTAIVEYAEREAAEAEEERQRAGRT